MCNLGLEAHLDPGWASGWVALAFTLSSEQRGVGADRALVSPSCQGRIEEAQQELWVNVGGWVLSACVAVYVPGTMLMSL